MDKFFLVLNSRFNNAYTTVPIRWSNIFQSIWINKKKSNCKNLD